MITTTGQCVALLIRARGGRAWSAGGKWGWIAPMDGDVHEGKFCLVRPCKYGPEYAVKSNAARCPGGHERYTASLLRSLGVERIVDGGPDN